MRLFILFGFLLLPITLLGQSIDSLEVKLDQVDKKLQSIDAEMDSLKQSKETLVERVSELQQKITEAKLKEGIEDANATKISGLGAKFRDKPSITGNIINELEKGDKVLVFDSFKKPYIKISHEGTIGYVSYSSLERNEYVSSIIYQMENKEKEQNRLKRENPDLFKLSEMYGKNKAKKLLEENPKLAKLSLKYGKEDAEKVMNRRIWIGMTRSMAKDVLGSPDDINTTRGSWGIHQQWVYNSGRYKYLYFENGKLTTIQR